MKGDREKCIEAGASDYIAKPVNTEQLLSAHTTDHRAEQVGTHRGRRVVRGAQPFGEDHIRQEDRG
jgi:CheY-like chemotaxis protein